MAERVWWGRGALHCTSVRKNTSDETIQEFVGVRRSIIDILCQYLLPQLPVTKFMLGQLRAHIDMILGCRVERRWLW
jgi:hypothetical protein